LTTGCRKYFQQADYLCLSNFPQKWKVAAIDGIVRSLQVGQIAE
jgi:hypothetical protein